MKMRKLKTADNFDTAGPEKADENNNRYRIKLFF
jgi:hypothetical protein